MPRGNVSRRTALLMAVALLLAGCLPAALVAGWVSNSRSDNLRRAQAVSCESLNATHREINEQNTAFLLHNEITRDTFAGNPHDPALRKAAHLYSEITSAYRVLPQIDCQRIADPGYALPQSRRPTKAELRRAYRKYLSVHRKHVP